MPPETEQLRDRLRAMLPELAEKYGVAELKLFGSRVRGDHRPDSDLDVLVTFREGAPMIPFGIVGLELYLTDTLGVEIDLTEKPRLKQRLRPYILAEAQPL